MRLRILSRELEFNLSNSGKDVGNDQAFKPRIPARNGFRRGATIELNRKISISPE
jgi:hypothetical protein